LKDGLALRFEAKAALALFIRADPEVGDELAAMRCLHGAVPDGIDTPLF
jgi:hypothetical protein